MPRIQLKLHRSYWSVGFGGLLSMACGRVPVDSGGGSAGGSASDSDATSTTSVTDSTGEKGESGADSTSDQTPATGTGADPEFPAFDERLRILGDGDFDQIGTALYDLGDLDGDGVDDLALRAGERRVVVVFGGLEGTHLASELLTDGLAFAITHAGWIDLSAADLDGDGTNEIVAATGPVGPASIFAEVSIIWDPERGSTIDLAQAPYPIWQSSELHIGGNFHLTDVLRLTRVGVVRAGELTGDGYVDLAIAANETVWIVEGPLAAAAEQSFDQLVDAGIAFGLGAYQGGNFAAVAVDDISGDTQPDLVLHQLDQIIVVYGAVERMATVDGGCKTGGHTWVRFGPGDLPSTMAAVGDVSGVDGARDALWGVPGDAHALIMHGGLGDDPCEASLALKTRLEELPGEPGGPDLFGAGVAGPGDLTGDGRGDILISNPATDRTLGRVWIVAGGDHFEAGWAEHHTHELPTYAVQSLAAEGRAARIDGEQSGAAFGHAVAGGAFVARGVPAFAVSAPTHDGGTLDGGRVSVFAASPP